MLQALSNKAKVKRQFTRQLKAMTDRIPVCKLLVLLRMLQALSNKAKVKTQFTQQLKAITDRISVCKRLVLLWMLQALSNKAKVKTQFTRQLKAMTDKIPVSFDFIMNVTRPKQRDTVYTTTNRIPVNMHSKILICL